MVLEVRKVIAMLEECCPWYIFTAKQSEMPQISPQILRNTTAKAVGRKDLKKVPRNPGGTGYKKGNTSLVLSTNKSEHFLTT